MNKDERDLLEVLKFELNFLEKGGYGRSPREPWRPQFIFEDSPTCINYDCKEHPAPCSDCVLMHWVPFESREAKIPCRNIPLNPAGETLDDLYRYDNQREIEESVSNWLRAAIHQLEEERKAAALVDPRSEPRSGVGLKGDPLYQHLHPKCANPACATPFHWLAGGKFFRFRSAPGNASAEQTVEDAPIGIHGVRHYWLCEHCSRIFALAHTEKDGVIVRLLWPEFPMSEARKILPAA
jgi:hypothetical protein